MATPLKLIRYAKTGFAQPGRINVWQPSEAYSRGDYVYNRERNLFYKCKQAGNSSTFPDAAYWNLVDEGAFESGITDKEIIIEVSKGDVVIRPLYEWESVLSSGPNRHIDLKDRPFTHSELMAWSHYNVRETAK